MLEGWPDVLTTRGTARNLPKNFVLFSLLFVLCLSVYCVCVNVYCITATGWQPIYSLTNISYLHWRSRLLSLLLYNISTLKMVSPRPAITLAPIYYRSWRHMLEQCKLQSSACTTFDVTTTWILCLSQFLFWRDILFF